MIGIPLGLAVFGYGEWATHKYLLHGLGRDRKSRFSFHFHDHHQAVRRNGGYDPAYEGPVLPDRLRRLARASGSVANVVQIAPDTQTAMALVSAEVDVFGTAPGMLATQ